jgi:hypothetical protein
MGTMDLVSHGPLKQIPQFLIRNIRVGEQSFDLGLAFLGRGIADPAEAIFVIWISD